MAVAVAERPSRSRRRRFRKDTGRSFLFTFVIVVVLAAFLAPVLRSLAVSLRTPQQVGQADSPQYPAVPLTFDYNGETYDLYTVPIDGVARELALIKPGRTQSQFIDPANVAAGPITWQGSWRTLSRAWTFSPAWQNYVDVWNLIDYPRLLLNTILLAIIGMIGSVVSCTLVAYGFARFRFPGRSLLFTLLVATIFLPYAVTLIPTYTIFVKLGWVGTWLPLLVPQAWPVIIAVAIFHFVYSWNDFFGPLIYLSTKPELQPLAVGLASFNGIHYRNPAYIQAGTIMTMVIPIILFLIFQRFFTRGIVITGVEK